MQKQIILSKIREYLKYKKISYKNSGNRVTSIECPYCGESAIDQIHNTITLRCLACKESMTLIDLVKSFETDKINFSDDEILQYLKEILKIDIVTEKEEQELGDLFDFYEKNNFDCVPVAKGWKNPIESEWTIKEHKKKEEWLQWVLNSLNLGVKTGEKSNITVLDIDAMPSDLKTKLYKGELSEKEKKEAYKIRKENLEKVLKKLENPEKDTLTLENTGGVQLFYKYNPELPKTQIKIEGVNIDVENQGGQVVIPPSKVAGQERKFNSKEIIEIPEAIFEIIQKNVTVPRKTDSEELKEEILTESFKLDLFEEGTRNDGLIRLGGVFSKSFSSAQTEKILHILNNHNTNPLPYKEINAMVRKLEHYRDGDEQELAHKILEYLREIESAQKTEIADVVFGQKALGEEKKRLDRVLIYLQNEDKILRRGRFYKAIKSMDWKDTIVDVGVPIDFKVPYFHDYAHFNKGDLIIIGSKTKAGKTSLAMNIVQRLVRQGLKARYIFSETGGRFAKTALHLGMKDKDFWRVFCGDPHELIIPNNEIIVYDWVRPPDFAKTDALFDSFVQKLQKTNSVMICFVQLRTNNDFFAKDLLSQYPALVAKYVYEDENDGTHTKFVLQEIRDPKMRGKTAEISCVYNWETKEVQRIDELENK